MLHLILTTTLRCDWSYLWHSGRTSSARDSNPGLRASKCTLTHHTLLPTRLPLSPLPGEEFQEIKLLCQSLCIIWLLKHTNVLWVYVAYFSQLSLSLPKSPFQGPIFFSCISTVLFQMSNKIILYLIELVAPPFTFLKNKLWLLFHLYSF